MPNPFRRIVPLAIPLVAALLLAVVLISRQSASASSHREAPLIARDAYADNTDSYVFISPDNDDNIVLIASYIPFEAPEGGPNYFAWDDNVLYDIYVDNDGDAEPDFTYTLQSESEVQNSGTFLYNTGPVTSLGDPNWNQRQTITVTEQREGGGSTTLLDSEFTAPVNIGPKSTPDFAALESQAVYEVMDHGDAIKIFAGQTDDPFWVDLQIFDLLTLRGQPSPIGYDSSRNIPIDSLSGFNVHSLVIELPIDRLTQGDETVLGVWSAARRPSMRVLEGLDGLGGQTHSGDYVQVSRLGMPLVNEVVMPLALKDAFNSLPASGDLDIYTHPTFGPILQGAVEDPEVGNLLCGLYGVPLPGDEDDDCDTEFTVGTPRSGRGDIFDIFLTGMVLANPFTIQTADGPTTLPAGFNVNRPADARPAEMLRINTAIKGDLCKPEPSDLGVLGGDACGFPNGRRLGDEVIEIELLAVAGAAYGALDGRDGDFAFNPDLIGVLNDGVDGNDRPFRDTFPYLAAAQSGEEHYHLNVYSWYMPVMPLTGSAAAQTAGVEVVATAATTAARENPVTAAGLGAALLALPAIVLRQRRKGH